MSKNVCTPAPRAHGPEIEALVQLRDTAGLAVLQTAVTRALARDAIGTEYLPLLAGQESELVLPRVPAQRIVDLDLATYEAFVQGGRAG